MRRAMFFDRLEGDWVRCRLCPHECRIPPSGKGICGVRENRGGELWSLVYGKLVARAVDPIEKKPLFHFLPGSKSYSIATVGCNLRCLNCQNYEISQSPKEGDGGGIFGEEADPEEVVDEAIITACDTIAYTYTEPTVFFEFAHDVASLAKRRGIRNLFITNGYISEEALREIAPHLDGANVDLKSISEDFYGRICGARLEPVLRAIRLYKELGIWIEVTTLLIPTLNDGEEELRAIARFIRGIGEGIPWHISQFYPMYKLTSLPRTPA
ncbi:MAG: AmmeMemoRadiSam system radical SAM enzyme, partial [Candidatus Bathyarchaeia archaeon]